MEKITSPNYQGDTLHEKVDRQYNPLKPSKFHSDQYHRRHRVGMEQLKRSSHLQNGESIHLQTGMEQPLIYYHSLTCM